MDVEDKMVDENRLQRPTRREFIKMMAAAAAVPALAACGQAPAPAPTAAPAAAAPKAPAPTSAPAVVGSAKPFAGTTINVAAWNAPFTTWLGDYIPEFEQKTGMKVNYETPAAGVYNQQADLELSTKGSAYDVLNITFVYTSRWIGAGWFTPLTDFLKDPNKTPSDWGVDDFLPGSVAAMKDKNGALYGIPWFVDIQMAAAGRSDLIDKAGLKLPDTFDDIVTMAKATNDKDGTKPFVIENHFGWSWISYLQGFGGNVFRNAPDDLMPTLDTPEAAEAADFLANLINSYSPEGALNYNYDQALTSMMQGRVNYGTLNQAWLVQLGDKSKSKVADTVRYSLMPAGPKGRFPGVASHAFGIPTGSKKKEAGWEFIKWALSKEMLKRMVTEKGYGAVTRKSTIDSPEFKKQLTINGQDTSDIYLKTIDLGAQGHMKYRTVYVYPQVDAQIDKLIQTVVSKQMSTKEALQKTQAACIADLKKAGVNL
jgi:multiple sugar transport system substrate-binding protein